MNPNTNNKEDDDWATVFHIILQYKQRISHLEGQLEERIRENDELRQQLQQTNRRYEEAWVPAIEVDWVEQQRQIDEEQQRASEEFSRRYEEQQRASQRQEEEFGTQIDLLIQRMQEFVADRKEHEEEGSD